MTPIKVNYLNNRDLLREIHLSKCSYSSFSEPTNNQFDIIVNSLSDITDQTITDAKQNKIKRYDLDQVNDSDLIFRIMTYDHIPFDQFRKKNPKCESDTRVRVNFPPFQHIKLINDQPTCVGKSHWCGDLTNGKFNAKHGQITNGLANMMIMLVSKYATRNNIRSYTYIDEMKSQAILQLVQVGLQFDESKSDNPFGYFTSVIANSFLKIMNVEKKNQNIRDDILEIHGMDPSYTRTTNTEYQNELRRNGEID